MATRIDNALKLILPISLLFFGTFAANAQIKYGFKTGLNFSRFEGPAETNAAGESLENWENVTGFHIGMSFGYKFTDNFGLRGEMIYSKRGSKYTFEGPSYRIFKHANGSVLTNGNARYLINVNNSYLDLPIMAYARYKSFEISGGGYVGVMVQSTGEGSLRYSGKTALGNEVYDNANQNRELVFNLNHNYRRDDPGGASSKSNDEAPLSVRADAFISETPKTMGAYFDHPEGSGNLYNTFDYGLVGGVTFYISRALYFHVRAQYGLADITNSKADLSKSEAPATTNPSDLKFRDDNDRNFVIQASVGFSF